MLGGIAWKSFAPHLATEQQLFQRRQRSCLAERLPSAANDGRRPLQADSFIKLCVSPSSPPPPLHHHLIHLESSPTKTKQNHPKWSKQVRINWKIQRRIAACTFPDDASGRNDGGAGLLVYRCWWWRAGARERAGLRGFLARPVTLRFIDTLMDCGQQRFRSRALMAQICFVSTAEPAAQILPE